MRKPVDVPDRSTRADVERDRRAARALIAWFAGAKRALPWRAEPRDPYRTWVSEVMLQQTRVDTVVPYFERFLARFPTVADLAEASEEDVMKAWEGLGYYSRARNLHAAAKAIAKSGFPRTIEGLASLPGFGPYTAGAVASLAFGARGAAVDGNVMRVLARFDADGVDVTTPAARKRFEARALEMQPAGEAGPFNEAMMELGALVCTPSSPRCEECPWAGSCKARLDGRVDDFPVKSPKAKPRDVALTALLVTRDDGAVLLVRGAVGLNAGLWAPPVAEGDAEAARAGIRDVEPLAIGTSLGKIEHVFTHRRWRVDVRLARAAGGPGEWVAREKLADYALAGWAKKALAKL